MMEKILKQKKQIISASNLISLLAICIISFLMASTSNALLFNPFILSTVWFSYQLSPFYNYTYLITLIGFSFLINVNYGLEILLIAILILLIEIIVKKINTDAIIKRYLSLIIVGILLSIRYLSISFSLTNFFNCLLNLSLSLIMANALDKIKDHLLNPHQSIEDINKLFAISLLYVLFLPLNQLNVFFISLISLVLTKYTKKEMVMASLFVVFIYNYLFFNVSIEFLVMYLISLFFSCFNKKLAPLIFLFTISTFYIVKYPNFYQDLGFYLNFALIAIYYLWPKYLDNKINNLFIKEEAKSSHLENEVTQLSTNIDKVVDYLNVIKKCPVNEKSIEEELIKNLEDILCNECQNKTNCSLRNNFNNYLIYPLNKDDKAKIINECYYPYKLIKRFEIASKSYIYQVSQQQDKIQNRILFDRQVDTILRPLTNINKDENKIVDEKKFEIEYQVISKGFSSQNGDSYQFINNHQKQLILLSDGMGHSQTSRQLSSYLIDLFTSLYKIDQNEERVIANINLILKTKTSDESFATLDLGIFDLYNGEMKLFKAGSFSSFLIRKNNLIQFKKIFPPLGIIDKIDTFYETIKIEKDDLFIFMSDGFGDEVNALILETIKMSNNTNLEEYLKLLYQQLSSNQVEDDKTLIIIKVN